MLGLDSQRGFLENQRFRLEATGRQMAFPLPPGRKPEGSLGTPNAKDVSQESRRERFGRHLRRSCALLRPVAHHKCVLGAILTPKWVQNGVQNLSKMMRETASEFDLVFSIFFKDFP